MNKKYFIYKYFTQPLAKAYWRLCRPKTYGSRAILINDKSEILLVRHVGIQRWSLPGGKIEGDETPEKCLARELSEELGVSDTKIQYKLGEYYSQREGKRDTIHIFVVKTDETELIKQYELDDAQWFPFSHLPITGDSTSKRIAEFRKGYSNLFENW